jgi:hypothetical protein
MPTPKDVAIQIEATIQEANLLFSKVVDNTQNSIYNLAVSKLRELDVDPDGYIRQTGSNRKIIRGVYKAFDEGLTKGGYYQGLGDFVATIKTLDAINAGYFSDLGLAKFNDTSTLITSLQKQSISTVEGLLMNDGLQNQIKEPLYNLLLQNVNTGGSYSGMVDQMRNYVKGTSDADGKLLRYTKQITQDVLNNYSRSYQAAIGAKLGLEFFQYVGGLMPESREFCRDRAGDYFHYKEIESWASLDWKGKRSDTTESSIFVYAGGINCHHQIMPVSTSIVPKAAIQRAIEMGFYASKAA